MRTLPKSDLKFRLTLRIIVLSAFCCAAGAVYILFDADRSARTRTEAVAELAAKGLELQQNRTDWVKSLPSEFPDLQTIAPPLMSPGLCIAYRAESGEVLQRFCGGAQSEDKSAPAPFVALYRMLFDPGREAVRAVMFHDKKLGEAVASIDPSTLTAQAWHEASRLLIVMIVMLVLLCALIYAALARALRPTRIICAGLERIAADDLSVRLPPFDLAELSAVRDVFNKLAERLERALAEQRALTLRLIAVQDDERRHLARELHDEFGQCLAAIRALAASIGHTAAQECPKLLAECDAIARTATQMMESLRGTLLRLRPPDVEELGLAASLEALVAGWNGRTGGRTRFVIGLCGDFESLPATFATNLYRIAQEAITNAAKHTAATRVVLELKECRARPPSDANIIELTVEDDGPATDQAVKSGMGFLGMRERVSTLGGRMSFAPGGNGGSVLRVAIPRPATTGRAEAVEYAA